MNLFEFGQFEMTNAQTENTVGGRRGKRRGKGKGKGFTNTTCENVTPPVIDEEVEIPEPIFNVTTVTDLDYQLLEDGQVPTPIVITN